MGHLETIHLRETERMIAPDARVLDVRFTEVRGERRTFWGRAKAVLQAMVWAAAIGFLIPPAWVLLQVVAATVLSF
ncbi:MAG TPA: hypothetical protein VEF55_09050 [Candidatus Binatia bacterium]|nr:hypothetical protein [Candidatus Binatia bacterium]